MSVVFRIPGLFPPDQPFKMIPHLNHDHWSWNWVHLCIYSGLVFIFLMWLIYLFFFRFVTFFLSMNLPHFMIDKPMICLPIILGNCLWIILFGIYILPFINLLPLFLGLIVFGFWRFIGWFWLKFFFVYIINLGSEWDDLFLLRRWFHPYTLFKYILVFIFILSHQLFHWYFLFILKHIVLLLNVLEEGIVRFFHVSFSTLMRRSLYVCPLASICETSRCTCSLNELMLELTLIIWWSNIVSCSLINDVVALVSTWHSITTRW